MNGWANADVQHARKLITEELVNFINKRARRDVPNARSNAEGQEMMQVFQYHLTQFSHESFEKEWAIRAEYGKEYGEKLIDKYILEADAIHEQGCDD